MTTTAPAVANADADALTAARHAVGVADQQVRDAADLVEALRERVRAGEDVTPGEIASARDVAEHAKLRAEAARRNAEQVAEQVRQARLAHVAGDLRAQGDDTQRLVQLMRAAEDALHALVNACGERDPVLVEARTVMHECGVPPVRAGAHGLAEHGGLSWNEYDGGVVVGGRWLRRINTGGVVAALVAQVAAEHGGLPYGSRRVAEIWGTPSDPYEVLRNEA
jgi:hypothetical protein